MMAESEAIRLVMKGMVSELDEDGQNKVKLLQDALEETLKGTGKEGQLAFALFAINCESGDYNFNEQ